MPVSAEHLRALADQVEAEETAARAELEDAETRTEREQAQAKIVELEEKLATLEQRLAADPPPPRPPRVENDDEDDVEDNPAPKPKTRKGRKHGMTYQDAPGEVAYVYQGEDEPDIVQLEDDDADAA